MPDADFPLDAAGQEDRGSPVWVWTRGFEASFAPFAGATERVVLSVPIGWDFQQHSTVGVVLVNTFGRTIGAGVVNNPGLLHEHGFRVRARDPVEVET